MVKHHYIKVTGEQIYNAIEQDGFGVFRSAWFGESDDGAKQACLLGGAGINLGVLVEPYEPGSMYYELNNAISGNPIGQRIINFFDDSFDIEAEAKETAETASEAVYKAFESEPDFDEAEAESKANAEFYSVYNETYRMLDKKHPEVDEDEWRYRNTWDESLTFAKEQLSAVWDKKFSLITYDYSVPENWMSAIEDDYTGYLRPFEDF